MKELVIGPLSLLPLLKKAVLAVSFWYGYSELECHTDCQALEKWEIPCLLLLRS